MKILLTGKNGQVGHELINLLSKFGNVLAVGKKDYDLTDQVAIKKLVQNFRPDVIVNPAAYTAVDEAENEKLLAKSINEIAPGILAEEAEKIGCLIIHFSSDYVFDGIKQGGYSEEDKPNPLSIYGLTKLGGELRVKENCTRHIIIRTSWIVGIHGNNFIKKILDSAKKRDNLKIVNDQFGAPTSAKLLANLTVHLIKEYLRNNQNFPFGLYHVAPSGVTNWYSYGSYVIENARKLDNQNLIKVHQNNIVPVSSSEFSVAAKRPSNSVLNTDKLQRVFDFYLPDWQHGVIDIIEEIYNA
jgi:dTDP-4-dehydrorhamnose reductase